VHAAEHAMIGMLPLFAICDRWDVGGVSMAIHPETGQPTIFIYDGYPGGAGIARLAFEDMAEHVHATAELVAACPCEAGCPSCVQSPKCGNWNEYLDKHAAIFLLQSLASGK
jgi:DEAD/DEAH box helicase domain-containing protein